MKLFMIVLRKNNFAIQLKISSFSLHDFIISSYLCKNTLIIDLNIDCIHPVKL